MRNLPTSRAPKRFVALARVSSREQEREGFSLDVQEQALRGYADRQGGEIVQFYRIAETASKAHERKTFKALLEYAEKHAGQVDAILFYKVDRAARNLLDYAELERIEQTHGVPFIAISQQTENNAAGRLNRRVLASMASFYTEQQSQDVREGLAKRAESGLFVGLTPYGYKNQRIDGRSSVILDPVAAKNVQRVFELYAFGCHTLDSLVEKLKQDGIDYTPASPTWPRSKLAAILRDRAYIGELKYKGQWLPGAQQPIVDRVTWDRVQARLGEKQYQCHDLTFAGELITCGHCGAPITGEAITKKTTGKTYVYYRCSRYTRFADHPKTRLTEPEVEQQVLNLFRRIRQPEPLRLLFQDMLHDYAVNERQQSRDAVDEIQRQLTLLDKQQDQLLNLRLAEEIDADTYGRKSVELRDRIATLSARQKDADVDRAAQATLAAKVFELSQGLEQQWLISKYAQKREILNLVCLNFRLDDVSLVPEMNKPFDMLAEGLLIPSSRGDKI